MEFILIVALFIGGALLAGFLGFFLLALFFRALIWLILLPFRVLGTVLGAVGGFLAGAAGLVFGLVLALGSLLLLPLIPLLVAGLVVWFLVRLARRPQLRPSV
jgi:hypothetical protein